MNRRLRRHLAGHEVVTTAAMGWQLLSNGALLRAAADAGFDALITGDKNVEYEQNLRTLPLPLLVIDAPSNILTDLLPFVPSLTALLAGPLERALYLVGLTESRKLLTPRT